MQAPAILQTPGIASTPVVGSPSFDPFPNDTNNDGEDNDVDPDDDGDGVSDEFDNCRLTPNEDQHDRDGDGIGDSCDVDRDGDEVIDYLELTFGSDWTDPSSTIEYVDFDSSCLDGVDNDLDNSIDVADTGCLDGDGDRAADADDNCPQMPNPSQFDGDQNGVGDFCELSMRINYVSDYFLNAREAARIGWLATESGSFRVVIGEDCSTGRPSAAGQYHPGTGIEPANVFTSVQAAYLDEGWNTVTVCVQGKDLERSDSVEILKDTQAPDTIIASGPLQDSTSDIMFFLDSSEPAGFECSLDGEPFKECESPQTYKGLSPGQHSFRARAWDAASNFDATPATRIWTVSP